MIKLIDNSKRLIFLAFGLFAVIIFIFSTNNETLYVGRSLQILSPLYMQHDGINHFLESAKSQD